MHDQPSDPTSAPVPPAATGAPGFPPGPALGQPFPGGPFGPPPAQLPWYRHWLTWLIVAMVTVIAAGATLFGYAITRPDPIAFPVGQCVSIEITTKPVEFACTEGLGQYQVVAREKVVAPVESACAKYDRATRAVIPDSHPDLVLCLQPTRFNITDPGQLLPGDCADVKGAGDSITRVDCDFTPAPVKVIGTELHGTIPVTDQACKNLPDARMAFAQSSLGGRAIVVCANSTDSKSMSTAQVGDCGGKQVMKRVACTDPTADGRVLSVRTVYGKPAHPECPNLVGANATFTSGDDKTDLVLLLCMGPADNGDARYAMVGDCAMDNNKHTGSALDMSRVDCGSPAATYQVSDRHDSNDNVCPSDTRASLTYTPGVTGLGLTVCLRRR